MNTFSHRLLTLVAAPTLWPLACAELFEDGGNRRLSGTAWLVEACKRTPVDSLPDSPPLIEPFDFERRSFGDTAKVTSRLQEDVIDHEPTSVVMMLMNACRTRLLHIQSGPRRKFSRRNQRWNALRRAL
jgi:hypothetical protein